MTFVRYPYAVGAYLVFGFVGGLLRAADLEPWSTGVLIGSTLFFVTNTIGPLWQRAMTGLAPWRSDQLNACLSLALGSSVTLMLLMGLGAPIRYAGGASIFAGAIGAYPFLRRYCEAIDAALPTDSFAVYAAAWALGAVIIALAA